MNYNTYFRGGGGDCKNLSHLKKYAERPGPPYPANQCCGMVLTGNDGLEYHSIADKNGVCAWKKINKKTAAKKTTKKTTKKSTKKATKKTTRRKVTKKPTKKATMRRKSLKRK